MLHNVNNVTFLTSGEILIPLTLYGRLDKSIIALTITVFIYYVFMLVNKHTAVCCYFILDKIQ